MTLNAAQDDSIPSCRRSATAYIRQVAKQIAELRLRRPLFPFLWLNSGQTHPALRAPLPRGDDFCGDEQIFQDIFHNSLDYPLLGGAGVGLPRIALFKSAGSDAIIIPKSALQPAECGRQQKLTDVGAYSAPTSVSL